MTQEKRKLSDFCVFLLRKIKKRYYKNLNEKYVIDKNFFQKTVKPFLSDKTKLWVRTKFT